jgi:hypothetical protein
MKTFLKAMAVGCMLAVTPISQSGRSEQAAPGSPQLRAHLANYEVLLTVRSYNPTFDQGLWYGGSEGRPRTVIQSLEIRFKGKRVTLRRGVYCDLAEANELRFKKQGQNVVLIISGGDAADSYRAYLTFKSGRLTQRRVEDGEFPKNFYEETKFVSIPFKD